MLRVPKDRPMKTEAATTRLRLKRMLLASTGPRAMLVTARMRHKPKTGTFFREPL